MNFYNKWRRQMRLLLILLCLLLPINSSAITAFATQDELNAEAEDRKDDPVETNDIPGWPQGPAIGAEAAILMDADTGAILYGKNIDGKEFPASTTKIMTCLVAMENCNLNEIITVNQSAIDANAPDGSNMGLHAGEQLTLEQLLYGILINSANEGCNAVGEHIAGSIEGYVEMMNQKATELGCQNTHFVSTNGLHSDDHYTSARDMALIAREFFQYDTLCTISNTPSYHIEATATNEEHYLNTHNRLLPGMDYEYEYLVGSKTGFTSNSRQCLVSCAEKNGMRLICVIFREESPNQFEDTLQLFEYGFSNFSKLNVAQYETGYKINHADFFNTDNAIYGSTSPLLFLDEASTIVIPNNIQFSDLDSRILYTETEDAFALIEYSYASNPLGYARILANESPVPTFTFSEYSPEEDPANTQEKVIIDIRKVLLILLIVATVGVGGFFAYRQIRQSQERKMRRRPIGRGTLRSGNGRGNGRRNSRTTYYEPADGKAMRFEEKANLQSITRPGTAARNETSLVPNLQPKEYPHKPEGNGHNVTRRKQTNTKSSSSNETVEIIFTAFSRIKKKFKKMRKKVNRYFRRWKRVFQELLHPEDIVDSNTSRMVTEEDRMQIERQISNQRKRDLNLSDIDLSRPNKNTNGHQSATSKTYGNTNRKRNDFNIDDFHV